MNALKNLPKGTVIYIAGPMTTKADECYNFKNFFYWQVMLERMGFVVINPAEMDCKRFFAGIPYDSVTYRMVLDMDRKRIREEAEAIFFLEQWEESPGAGEEREEGAAKKIPFFYELTQRISG